ncbi:hypothetical protein EV207_10491 [Scopulibacillus darangshiensis]|uniref:Uncharacterized protein n=1 Tax=Scopulibacillus darangshiensis TaxID=442528 RepID=A0A4R2P7N7_9BACL|nr:hypothetical protein [Scopulibacillus darangshiensis]TCP30912.1 hypothetical protein EV207_10491 [Scopulibacillus darangshiensis]
MEEKLNAILESLETLKNGQIRLDEKIGNFSTETRSSFKHVESIFGEHQEFFRTVSDQMKKV